MSGGPVNIVQSTRHRQLLDQYSEYLPITERLQLELLETVDQLRDLPRRAKDGDEEAAGVSSKWDEDTIRGLKAWAEDIGVSWRALRVRASSMKCKPFELTNPTLSLTAVALSLQAGQGI